MVDPLVEQSSLILERLSGLIYEVTDPEMSEELRFLHRKLSETLSMTEDVSGSGEPHEVAVKAAEEAARRFEKIVPEKRKEMDLAVEAVRKLIDSLQRLHLLTA